MEKYGGYMKLFIVFIVLCLVNYSVGIGICDILDIDYYFSVSIYSLGFLYNIIYVLFSVEFWFFLKLNFVDVN